MKVAFVLVLLAAAALLATYWMQGHSWISQTPIRSAPTPLPEAPKKGPAESKHQKRSGHIETASSGDTRPVRSGIDAPAAVDEQYLVVVTPDTISKNAAAPDARPFPDVAEIPVGVEKQALAAFREPTIRAISAGHRQLNETYVYCPRGPTDTWVRLKDGKIVERHKVEHTPTGDVQ
jgi:hypothetical protein